MRTYVNHIITDESAVIMTTSGLVSVLKDSNEKVFAKVVSLLRDHKGQSALEEADNVFKIQNRSGKRFSVKDGQVYIDKKVLPNILGNRLLQFVDAKLETKPLERFWDNLSRNSVITARNELYGFLEHNGIPITEDGCFIAYKRVKGDFKDFHSGEFDNSVGKVVKMNRKNVDKDRNNTCSNGLHVAAFKYANENYMGNQGVLLEVKVNPADVCAVPNDYSAEKMRVCKYEVVKVCKEELKTPLYKKDDVKVEHTSWNVTVDITGRLTIPVEALRAIGVGVRKAYVFSDMASDRIGIYNDESMEEGDKELQPDQYGNIKISKTMLVDTFGDIGDNDLVVNLLNMDELEITSR